MPVSHPFPAGHRHGRRSGPNRAAPGPPFARDAPAIHALPDPAAYYDPCRDLSFPVARHQDCAFGDSYGSGGGRPPPLKRRRLRSDGAAWDGGAGANAASTSSRSFAQPPRRGDDAGHGVQGAAQAHAQRALVRFEGEDAAFVSRDEIERCSPSRKDGIDSLLETQLRFSYCSYLKNLGMRLDLPQTTVGAAMVLCHRFFFRRSHACHDRFLIATAALFLAAKSEETPCLLNSVLRASCESSQELELAYYPYLHHKDWFEQYRERVIETEQKILTTLDFELEVEHPYVSLTSVLNKLGLSHSVLLSVAWNLVNEVQASSYSCWSCTSRCKVPKLQPGSSSKLLAGVSNDAIHSSRYCATVDGANVRRDTLLYLDVPCKVFIMDPPPVCFNTKNAKKALSPFSFHAIAKFLFSACNSDPYFDSQASTVLLLLHSSSWILTVNKRRYWFYREKGLLISVPVVLADYCLLDVLFPSAILLVRKRDLSFTLANASRVVFR